MKRSRIPYTVAQQFIDWAKKKIQHNIIPNNTEIYFEEREIWWVALGKNIGYEVDGKNDLFERPVLILKKYSKDMCFVLPMTTQVKKDAPWYQIQVIIEDELRGVNITQGRVISTKRLLRKKDKLDSEQFESIRSAFRKQFE
jgi:mRNA-degrading endonuclease toxin of MazEF toxin-antitoxin module